MKVILLENLRKIGSIGQIIDVMWLPSHDAYIIEKDLKEYFGSTTVYGAVAVRPLDVLGVKSGFDLVATVKGGGITGQADAVSLALARALCLHELKANPFHASTAEAEDDEESSENVLPWKSQLKSKKLLTRNARVVERKKYGFRKARKKEQYSKR